MQPEILNHRQNVAVVTVGVLVLIGAMAVVLAVAAGLTFGIMSFVGR